MKVFRMPYNDGEDGDSGDDGDKDDYDKLPGVALVEARAFLLHNILTSDDFPTFDLPRNITSGTPLSGLGRLLISLAFLVSYR